MTLFYGNTCTLLNVSFEHLKEAKNVIPLCLLKCVWRSSFLSRNNFRAKIVFKRICGVSFSEDHPNKLTPNEITLKTHLRIEHNMEIFLAILAM